MKLFGGEAFALLGNHRFLKRRTQAIHTDARQCRQCGGQRGAGSQSTLATRIPGGAMVNFTKQLRQQHALERREEIIKAMPRVREDLGWVSLVTPTSRIAVSQATFNVLMILYKIIADHVGNLPKGLYGETPVPGDKELQGRVLQRAERVSARPAELPPPMLARPGREIPTPYGRGVADSRDLPL